MLGASSGPQIYPQSYCGATINAVWNIILLNCNQHIRIQFFLNLNRSMYATYDHFK